MVKKATPKKIKKTDESEISEQEYAQVLAEITELIKATHAKISFAKEFIDMSSRDDIPSIEEIESELEKQELLTAPAIKKARKPKK